MPIDLTPIFQAVIALLAALITYWLIPMIKTRLDKDQRDLLKAAIQSAVYTAEQLFGAGHGAEKMDYALKWLREQGYTVDSREIEAAVYNLLNQWKDLTPQETTTADQAPNAYDDDLK